MTTKSTHEKLSEAGKKGGEASHGGSSSSGSEDERSLHEKRVDAGRAGGEAPHECRGRECTHPSHKKESSSSSSESTHEKLSEAGKKGAAAQPHEAKVKGGKH
jgi:general stress protein YciG